MPKHVISYCLVKRCIEANFWILLDTEKLSRKPKKKATLHWMCYEVHNITAPRAMSLESCSDREHTLRIKIKNFQISNQNQYQIFIFQILIIEILLNLVHSSPICNSNRGAYNHETIVDYGEEKVVKNQNIKSFISLRFIQVLIDQKRILK